MLKIVLAIIGGIAVFNGVFYALILFYRKGVLNGLLAGLALSLALRIFKSIVAFSFVEVSDWIPALGLIGMSAIGPFLYLYTTQFYQRTELGFKDLMHFVFPLAIAMAVVINNGIILRAFYITSAVQLLVYVVCSFNFLRTTPKKKWVQWINYLVLIIALTFVFQLSAPSLPMYIGATTVAGICLHLAVFLAFKHRKIFNGSSKNGQLNELEQTLKSSLLTLLDERHIYRELDLDLAKLARHLQTKPHVLSKVVNTSFNRSVPELLNEYRVNDVKKQLSDPNNRDKIEIIALSCGFKSSAIFYKTFKKFTGTSPTQFKEQFN